MKLLVNLFNGVKWVERRIFKSKVLLKITEAVKQKDEAGNDILKVISEKYEQVSGKQLWESYCEDKRAHPIFEVFEKPRELQAGAIYVLNGGKRAWVLNIK